MESKYHAHYTIRLDDNTQVIDTYDDTYHYRMYQSNDPTDPVSENGWVYEQEIHGYPKCPLLYKRGKVAWEYAESTIRNVGVNGQY